MRTGDKIKKIMLHRNLTQKEFRLALGFFENTASVRVNHWETNYFEWKLNWSDTCDDNGCVEPKLKWRKPNNIEGNA